MIGFRIGKRAFYVPEKLAFKQRRRKSRAVDPHERLSFPIAFSVYLFGNELFSDTAFAGDDDRKIRLRDAVDHLEQIQNDRALCDKRMVIAPRRKRILQRGNFILRGLILRRIPVRYARLTAQHIEYFEIVVVEILSARFVYQFDDADAFVADAQRNRYHRFGNIAGLMLYVIGKTRIVYDIPQDKRLPVRCDPAGNTAFIDGNVFRFRPFRPERDDETQRIVGVYEQQRRRFAVNETHRRFEDVDEQRVQIGVIRIDPVVDFDERIEFI